MLISTNYTNGTATSFLEGSEAGWKLGTLAGGATIAVLNPVSGVPGICKLYLLPGTDNAHTWFAASTSADATLTNFSALNMGTRGDIGEVFLQSVTFGTGAPITTQDFGESAGTANLAAWNIQFAGVTKFQVTPVSASAPSLITTACTVATLPAAPVAGQRAFVTDSNAASFTAGIGAVVATGGTTHVPVVYDGTSWRIG